MSYSINNHEYNYPDSTTVTIADNTSAGNGIYSVTGNTNPNFGQYQYNTGGGYTWTTPIAIGTNTDTITISDWPNSSINNSLAVKGDASFEGDVKIKGKSLVESLEKIEEKLAILRPNEALEEKWNKLRELRNAYMELEKEILKKEKMWGILKK